MKSQYKILTPPCKSATILIMKLIRPSIKKVHLYRILSIALVALILILLIAAIISVTSGTKPTTSSSHLTTNTTEMSLELQIRGPIVADEDFKTSIIKISSSERSITNYEGYSSKEADSKKLSNTYVAYDEFIHALDQAKLFSGKSLNTDFRGLCSSGTLYVFRLKQADETIDTRYSTTCSSQKGDLKPKFNTIYSLFTSQVPDAKTFISANS